MPSDHFIPQFYLRHFQIPGRNGWIYSYKRSLKPKPLAIKSVACAEDYYALKGEEVFVPRDFPDKFLSMGEDAAAPILAHLLSAPKLSLSEDDRTVISIFVAFLALRTPMARARALNIHKAIQARKMQSFATDREEFINVVMNELKLVETEEEAEKQRQLHLEPDKNFILNLSGELDDFSLERVFKSADPLVQILLKKKLVLVEAPRTQYFVTSDNPFATLIPEPYIRGMDVSPMNAECLFPISPRRALLFSNRIGGNSVYKPSKQRMTKWVNDTIFFAFEQLFSHTVSERVQAEFERVPAGAITEVPMSSIPAFPPPKRRNQ